MKPVVVWFNHWFSTAFHIIELIKKDCKYELHVIGSNRNPDSVVQLACDEWHTEPDTMSDEEYLEFCAEFCSEHHVEVFVPRRGMSIISRNSGRFREMGVKLLLDQDSAIIDILKNKISTYRRFENVIPECIPMHFEVGSSEEFLDAYEKITAYHERACLKFADDEGASSFRVIDNSLQGKTALYTAPGMKITFDKAVEIMEDYDFARKLIVMPYLKEVEVSADCLNTRQGKIIIPRFKENGRIYTIRFDEDIMEYCRRIMDDTGLEMPCNIQFKYNDSKPYLLEVNTRMSGGVQLSCIGTGVNIPQLAFYKTMGSDTEWSMVQQEQKVSYIESPVRIP